MKTSHLSLAIILALLCPCALPAQSTKAPERSSEGENIANVAQPATEPETIELKRAPAEYQQTLDNQAITRLGWYTGGAHQGPLGNEVLVVRFTQPPENETDLEDDLGVMSHLLHKTLNEKLGGFQNKRNVLGVEVAFEPGARPIRTAFIEGYGAVFLLNVPFPLYPPPAEQKGLNEKTESDSAWEQARREYRGEPLEQTSAVNPAYDYDERNVSSLKTSLLQVVKSAANIRGLDQSDYIVVCISGGPSVLSQANGAQAPNRFAGSVSDGLQLAQTTLTLRVKKSDVDALASGKLTAQEFAKVALFSAYQTRAGAGGPENMSAYPALPYVNNLR